MVAPPSGKALAHIASMKVGVTAVKYGRNGLPQAKLFTLSEDEQTLSWKDAQRSLSSMAKRNRSLRIADVATLIESASLPGANISLKMQAGGRASLDVRCANAIAHARWVSALTALIAQAHGVDYVPPDAPEYKREEEASMAAKPRSTAEQAAKDHPEAAELVSFGDIRERWVWAQAERESAAEWEQEELEAEAMAWAEVEQTLAETMETADAAVASVSERTEAVAEGEELACTKQHDPRVEVEVRVPVTRNTSAVARARRATAATKARLAVKMKPQNTTKNVGALMRARASKVKRGARHSTGS